MWGYPEFYIPVPGGYGTEATATWSGMFTSFASRKPTRRSLRP